MTAVQKISGNDPPFNKPFTHNEIIEFALKAAKNGEFDAYHVIDFSCSTFENPIQMICRHKGSGRIKVANIDRINGSIFWDDDSVLWN